MSFGLLAGWRSVDILPIISLPILSLLLPLAFCQNTGQEWSHERQILIACEKTSSKQGKSCNLGVFKTTEFILECVFVSLSGIASRKEWIYFVYLPPWKKNIFLPCVAGPCDCILYWCDSSWLLEYKLNDALNKVDCCMRLCLIFRLYSSRFTASARAENVCSPSFKWLLQNSLWYWSILEGKSLATEKNVLQNFSQNILV